MAQKHWLSLFCILLLTLFSCVHTKEVSYVNCNQTVQAWTPSWQLQELLKNTNVKTGNSLGEIVQATQKAWLRPAGLERWQAPKQTFENPKDIEKLLAELGLVASRYPTLKKYKYVVVLGAIVSSVQARMLFTVELFKQGIRFDTVVFLGSKRPLFKDVEQVPPDVKTETQMMEWVWKNTAMPKALRQLPLTVIDTPMRAPRPNTDDTIVAWLATQPAKGTVLAISSQPFVDYQQQVLLTRLPDWSVETVGPVAGGKMGATIDVMLDSYARYLYQLHLRLSQCKPAPQLMMKAGTMAL